MTLPRIVNLALSHIKKKKEGEVYIQNKHKANIRKITELVTVYALLKQ